MNHRQKWIKEVNLINQIGRLEALKEPESDFLCKVHREKIRILKFELQELRSKQQKNYLNKKSENEKINLFFFRRCAYNHYFNRIKIITQNLDQHTITS